MPDKKPRPPAKHPTRSFGGAQTSAPGVYGPRGSENVSSGGERGNAWVRNEVEAQAMTMNLGGGDLATLGQFESSLTRSEDGGFAAKADGSALHMEHDGVAVDVGQAYAHAVFDGGNRELSFGANAVAIAANRENYATHSDDDWESTVGLSAGSSFGVRTHATDEDGDGVREMGLGFDLGPLSVDLKSEALDMRPMLDRMVERAEILAQVVPDERIRSNPLLLTMELDAIAHDPVRARAALEIARAPNWLIERLVGDGGGG